MVDHYYPHFSDILSYDTSSSDVMLLINCKYREFCIRLSYQVSCVNQILGNQNTVESFMKVRLTN